MGLTSNAIVSLTVEGTVQNQRTLTVLHLRRITAVDPATTITSDLERILDETIPGGGGQNWIQDIYLASCASNYTMNAIVAQSVAPSRSVKVTRVIGLPGFVAGDCEIPNVSGVLTKRTVLAGRNQVGSIHMPGIPTVGVDNGLLTLAQSARYATLAGGLLLDLVTRVSIANYDLVIHHAKFPGTFNKVTTILTQTTSRVMRRRTVGLGI